MPTKTSKNNKSIKSSRKSSMTTKTTSSRSKKSPPPTSTSKNKNSKNFSTSVKNKNSSTNFDKNSSTNFDKNSSMSVKNKNSSTSVKSPHTKTPKKTAWSFKTYINRVKNDVHEGTCIAGKTRDQLDKFLNIMSTTLAMTAHNACLRTGKKTINDSEVALAVNLWIPVDLAKQCVEYMNTAIEKSRSAPKTENEPSQRREIVAGLIFSVSLAEKFLRSGSNLSVGKFGPIALAASLEWVTKTILNLAGEITREHKKMTINTRHVYLAIAGDSDLTNLFINFGIILMGGGVVPFIHKKLIPSKEKRKIQDARRRKNAKNSGKEGGTKPKKLRPGTRALMNIRKEQKDTSLRLRRLPFQRAIRKIAADISTNNDLLKEVRFGNGTILSFQAFVEERVIGLLRNAVGLAVHAKRDGVNRDDVMMSWRLTETRIPIQENYEIGEVRKNEIENLAFRAGVKIKKQEMFKVVKQFMYALVNIIVYKTLLMIKHRNVVTINIRDVEDSLRPLGYNFISELPEKTRAKRTTTAVTTTAAAAT